MAENQPAFDVFDDFRFRDERSRQNSVRSNHSNNDKIEPARQTNQASVIRRRNSYEEDTTSKSSSENTTNSDSSKTSKPATCPNPTQIKDKCANSANSLESYISNIGITHLHLPACIRNHIISEYDDDSIVNKKSLVVLLVGLLLAVVILCFFVTLLGSIGGTSQVNPLAA